MFVLCVLYSKGKRHSQDKKLQREQKILEVARFSSPVLYRTWDPPRLLYNTYRVLLQAVKRQNRDISHLPLTSAEVKERVEL